MDFFFSFAHLISFFALSLHFQFVRSRDLIFKLILCRKKFTSASLDGCGCCAVLRLQSHERCILYFDCLILSLSSYTTHTLCCCCSFLIFTVYYTLVGYYYFVYSYSYAVVCAPHVTTTTQGAYKCVNISLNFCKSSLQHPSRTGTRHGMKWVRTGRCCCFFLCCCVSLMCCNWWNGFMVRSLTQATPTSQSERVVQAHRILVGILAAAAVGTISRLFTCKLLCKGYFLFVLVIFRPFYEFFPLIPLTRRRMQCNWAVKSLAWAYFKVLHGFYVSGRPKELMFGKVNITFFFHCYFLLLWQARSRDEKVSTFLLFLSDFFFLFSLHSVIVSFSFSAYRRTTFPFSSQHIFCFFSLFMSLSLGCHHCHLPFCVLSMFKGCARVLRADKSV